MWLRRSLCSRCGFGQANSPLRTTIFWMTNGFEPGTSLGCFGVAYAVRMKKTRSGKAQTQETGLSSVPGLSMMAPDHIRTSPLHVRREADTDPAS